MSTTKQRERAYAAKREAKWAERLAARRARRRRLWTIVAFVSVVAVVGTIMIAALASSPDTSDDAAEPTTAPSADAYTLPDPSFAEGRTWTAAMTTSAGDLTLELDGAAAPQAVASFVYLAQQGYFDGTQCHRLTTGSIHVLQCGDPTATGSGGPGYTFGPVENAPADNVYPAGTIAMARVGNDGESMGSQFFLVYEDSTISPDSAGGYTVFGKITSGLDIVQAVADAGVTGGASDGAPVTPVTIEGVDTQ
ncbi:peptidylprolyl isomerase [Antribacter sp. KLBMP9083]|uniref:Peptidylprolyl isomerase n=1 Tax=Antribacter soli TaxID=2910976 RepID=A0AA41QEV7_9MICO|nr:peptidylprolyl isomerase [Antribacter soli]MCF4121856.1 peptidylprolyl isomerase [Antribacter soli]